MEELASAASAAAAAASAASAAAAAAVATRKTKPPPRRFIKSQIPESILSDPSLNAAVALLPQNYNLEVHKCVHRVRSAGARRVALQFPDGLLMYALPLADILRAFAGAADVVVLAEPTYGACCVDDLAAAALSADLLIHYGHSCLVPVTLSKIPALYVHVEIRVDVARLVAVVVANFRADETRLIVAGTVQFNASVHGAAAVLSAEHGFDVVVPQAKPLSAGEVLGCTAPKVKVNGGDDDKEATLVFVADGRFHLEAMMIANPKLKAFRYDPYLGVLFKEEYDHGGMKAARQRAVEIARGARRWGVVLGTLGRQGSVRLLDRVVGKLEEKGLEYTVVLVSELSPSRAALFGDSVDAWVQIACPRLSIDWGEAFEKPLLTTFELEVALGYVPGWWEKEKISRHCGTCDSGSVTCGKDEKDEEYPMDYYAQDGGDWNSSYAKHRMPARASRGTLASEAAKA